MSAISLDELLALGAHKAPPAWPFVGRGAHPHAHELVELGTVGMAGDRELKTGVLIGAAVLGGGIGAGIAYPIVDRMLRKKAAKRRKKKAAVALMMATAQAEDELREAAAEIDRAFTRAHSALSNFEAPPSVLVEAMADVEAAAVAAIESLQDEDNDSIEEVRGVAAALRELAPRANKVAADAFAAVHEHQQRQRAQAVEEDRRRWALTMLERFGDKPAAEQAPEALDQQIAEILATFDGDRAQTRAALDQTRAQAPLMEIQRALQPRQSGLAGLGNAAGRQARQTLRSGPTQRDRGGLLGLGVLAGLVYVIGSALEARRRTRRRRS